MYDFSGLKTIIDAMDLDENQPVFRSSMNTLEYVREFRTLVFGLPRGVGKTKFIQNNCRAGDLVIVPTFHMTQTYARSRVRAKSIGHFLQDYEERMRGIRRERDEFPFTIWTDEIRSTDNLWSALEHVIVSKDQKVIVLGTF